MAVEPDDCPTTPPLPFSDSPAEARACEPHLRLLVAIGPIFLEGCYSLSHAHREVRRRLGAESPSYSSLRLLPHNLAALLQQSFGREVELYRTVRLGRRIVGLSADGVEALRLAHEYLATSDA